MEPEPNVKLREDLLISRQETSKGTEYVVKDPATDRFFKFGETEGFILQRLDGTTSLQELRGKVEEQFSASVPEGTLERFVTSLNALGLLGSPAETQGKAPKRRRVNGDLFYLRVRLFDPDALFDRLSKPLGFLFKRVFLIVAGIMIVTAVGIAVSSWNEVQRDVYSLFQFFSLFVAWVIVLSVVTLHEFAHGMTCKHFGGRVHEIGFMLIYFMPAFYCNVSDAWLFPEKSSRLWVTFAGAFFELFLWALSTFAWLLTEPRTMVNNVALVVMASSGIKQLFNLNPLIKLDGYYLLSDFLNIPNLRRRALAYIKDRIGSLFGPTVPWVEEATPRERTIYVVYGVLSSVYTTWLIGTFAMHFGNYLMSSYQGWGFILFSVFLVGLFRNRLQVLLSKPFAWFRSLEGRMLPMKKSWKIGLLLALLFAGAFFTRLELGVSSEFTILPIHNADARVEVEEIITQVYVEEGDTVQAGDPIVQLSDRALTSEHAKTTSEIEESQAKLNLLRAGARKEEIQLAKIRVEKARELIGFAGRELARDTALFQRGILSQKELDESRELASVRKKELEEASGALEVLSAGSRREDVQALEAQIRRLMAQQQYLQAQLRMLTVRSPAAGVIATPKLKERLGQYVAKGELIAKVHELETVKVELPVSEKDIGDVKVGQTVIVKARAYPHRAFQGSVISIGSIATKEDQWREDRTVVVTAILDNAGSHLKSGMSGHAKIYCGERRLYELLLRGMFRFFRIEVWSWF